MPEKPDNTEIYISSYQELWLSCRLLYSLLCLFASALVVLNFEA
jgi:hypothetical protein